MCCIMKSKTGMWQVEVPLILLLAGLLYHGFESCMEPFQHAICLGVVGGYSNAVDPKYFGNLLHEV